MEAKGVIPHYHQPVLNVHTLGILITASALILWERRRLPQFHIDGLVLRFLIPGRPAVFLIVVPATALVAGLFAWKNRSAAPSMVVYALVSTFVWF